MSSYFAFYNYMNEVLKIKFNVQEKYDWFQKTSQISLMYPLENVCIISDRPEQIHMKDGRLHADGKPAVKYTDGFSVWSLNGVRVTKEIAETPAMKLDPKIILKEQNAEIRREIVRKIGVERLITKLGAKVMDKRGDYELLNINIGDNRVRPYLKMRNPSINTWHVEGIHPNCKTVEQALNWRNGTEVKPEILT